MIHRGSLPVGEREARSRLAQLVHGKAFVCGSLVRMARRCGKPRCKCRRGKKHISLYLSVRLKRTRKLIYIPSEWEETLRAWVAEYREMGRLIEEVSQANLGRLLKAKETGGETQK